MVKILRGLFRLCIWLAALAVILYALYAIAFPAYIEKEFPKEYPAQVSQYAEEYGVDENLIYAVMKTESDFDPAAVSDVGAIGLMQMTEETFEWLQSKTGEYNLSFEDLYTPDTSVKYGTYFLSILLDSYNGDLTTAIAAYHAGMGSVDSWLSESTTSANGTVLTSIPASATAHYVDKVICTMEVYENPTPGVAWELIKVKLEGLKSE